MKLPELLEEQERDAGILAARSGAADWSEAGAVKTLTSLRAVQLREGNIGPHSPLLVIASPISLRMWSNVAPAFFKTQSVLRIASSKDAKRLDHDVTVVSYDLVARNKALAEALMRREYAGLILDEAHALANIEAKRTQAIYGRGARGDGLIKSARMTLALTGTPIPRYADGLFPVLKALGPDILDALGTFGYDAFLKKFTHTEMKSYHPRQQPKLTVIRSKNKDELSDAVFEPIGRNATPFAVRRYVDELTKLPPVTFTDLEIDYIDTPELREATAQVEYEELYGASTPSTSVVRHLLGIAKGPVAAPVLQQIREDYHSPVLAFFWHTAVGVMLEALLSNEGYKVAILDGHTSTKNKNKIEDAWNAGELDFIIGQIASMGESLNLQKGGNVAVFVEHDWSKARHEQAYKRVLRFGQDKHVQVFHLYADHAADDAAGMVAARKNSDAMAILDKRRIEADAEATE